MRLNSPLDRALPVMASPARPFPPSSSASCSFIFAVRPALAALRRLRAVRGGPRRAIQRDAPAAFALGFSAAGLLARLVRSSMLDVLREDYVRTAFAKGLPEQLVIVRHALRNALIPALTVIGISIGALLGGAVVTETVFTIPGMGRLVVQSIARRDYPVIQGAIIAIAMTYVLVNLIVDVLYVYIDPRVRLGGDDAIAGLGIDRGGDARRAWSLAQGAWTRVLFANPPQLSAQSSPASDTGRRVAP